MKKICFFNRFKFYMIVAFLGILAGLAVAFFSQFPSDDLWAFSLFSSMTFGFWMCTSSLIALFSEKNYVAGINVGLYVYLMFYVTGIFKRLAVVRKGYNDMSFFYNGFWQEIAYGILPAILCFWLAFALWYGRKDKPFFIAVRFAPAAFILAELIILLINLITNHIGLFMVIIDSVCFVIYVLIMIVASKSKKASDIQ